MFIVTNRAVDEADRTLKAFKDRPNDLGPNELRLAEAVRSGKHWQVRILPDYIDDAMAAEVGLPLPGGAVRNEPGAIPASRYVAHRLLKRIQPATGKGSGRQLLLFVHGYNNDMKAVLDRAEFLEKTYDIEVVAFSWPANGGGLHGTASYRSDKRDALASTGALDRVLARIHAYIEEINKARVEAVEKEAEARFPDDAEKWDRFYAKSLSSACPFSVNLLLHSMGNYVYKHFMKSSVYRGNLPVFDNVVMVAADTNNEGHVEWVDRIQCRGRVFITLNEKDRALAASRMKMGEQQKARLGHFPYLLDARRAHYIDFTGASWVGDSHAYFEGSAMKNASVKRFFTRALNGEYAEDGLRYDAARNVYAV